MRRNRSCTYASASGFVMSAIATTRSARAAADPEGTVAVAHHREPLVDGAEHDEALLDRLGRARFVDHGAERPEEAVEALAGDGRDPHAGKGRVVGDVGLAAHDEPGTLEQLRPVAAQLVDEDTLLLHGGDAVDAGQVEQQDEHAGPLDVAQEPVTEPAPLRRALDEPGDVGQHHLVVLEADDPEVRLQRGEGVVRNLRLRRTDRGDQGRLARVGEPDQRRVGQELHLELEPELLAVLALLGEPRRPARVREEPGVAAPALPPTRREVVVAVASRGRR